METVDRKCENIKNNAALLCTPTADNKMQENETPARKITRVRNPFEKAIVERLHLPIIGSPSLFQIPPQTPKMSSTVFEWTIDEVSYLKPVHLEADETQFEDSPNPDLEAKAQSAISSYFKEQIIVPSPIDCPLRKNRIILAEMNADTPLATKLCLPPILPDELEIMLSNYMQPICMKSASSTPTSVSSDDLQHLQFATEAAAKDISLRRKLFDKHNIILLDNGASTPTQSINKQRTAIAGKLSDSFDKSSNCSLSPINAIEGFSSPDDGFSYKNMRMSHANELGVKRKVPDFLQKLQDIEDLSPIARPSPKSRRISIEAKRLKSSFITNYRMSLNVSDLSAISHTENNETQEISVIQMAGQQMNLSLNEHVLGLGIENVQTTEYQEEVSSSYETELPNTPRCAKRGKTKSKNLSLSFSSFLEDDVDIELAEENNGNITAKMKFEQLVTSEQKSSKIKHHKELAQLKTETEICCKKSKVTYITAFDSGFNEQSSRAKDNYAIVDDDFIMQ